VTEAIGEGKEGFIGLIHHHHHHHHYYYYYYYYYYLYCYFRDSELSKAMGELEAEVAKLKSKFGGDKQEVSVI